MPRFQAQKYEFTCKQKETTIIERLNSQALNCMTWNRLNGYAIIIDRFRPFFIQPIQYYDPACSMQDRSIINSFSGLHFLTKY